MMTLELLFSQILVISVFFLSGCSKDSSPEPSVSFSMDNTTARVGETITFTNASQYATSYEWDFGDGNSSTEENPTHSYSSYGVFSITLTANGDGGSGSATKSITIWELVLESTFYGNSVELQGPTNFKTQPVKLLFHNKSSGVAAANLIKANDGYSHQDMLNIFDDGIAYVVAPSWTTKISGVRKEINPDSTSTWVGNLEPGLYALVSIRIDPFAVFYVAGFTVIKY